MYAYSFHSAILKHVQQHQQSGRSAISFLQCYHCSALTQIHFELCKMSENKCQSVSKASKKVISLIRPISLGKDT